MTSLASSPRTSAQVAQWCWDPRKVPTCPSWQMGQSAQLLLLLPLPLLLLLLLLVVLLLRIVDCPVFIRLCAHD